MSKRYNSSSSYQFEVGGGLPFVIHPELLRYRMYGFKVLNTLSEGEKVAAGTPMMIDVANGEAKLLKMWKIKTATADAEAGTTTLVIYKNDITPELKAGTVLIVAPSTLNGTGKAAAPLSVSVGDDGNYSVVVTTNSFDTLSANGIICEAAETGSGKKMYCQPNSILTVDLVAGNEYNHVDAPVGFLHCYENTINPMSTAVKNAINGSSDFRVVWEKFNTVHSA